MIPKCKYSYLGVFVFIFLNLGIQNFVKAQSHLSKEGELIQNHWTRKDGLPEWLIPHLFQDSKGLMWLGMNTDIYNFDGLNFRKVYDGNENKTLEEIKGISEDAEGRIWFLIKSKNSYSIHIYDYSTEKTISFKDYTGSELPLEISKGTELNLFYNNNNSIWIGMDGNVFRWNGSLKKYFNGEGKWNNLTDTWKPGINENSWIIDFESETTYLIDSVGHILDQFEDPGFDFSFSFQDSSNNLWLGYKSKGSKIIDHFRILSESEKKITHTFNYSKELDFYPFEWNRSSLLRDLMFFKKSSLIEFLPVVKKSLENYPETREMGSYIIDKNGGFWVTGPEGLFRYEWNKSMPFKKLLFDLKPKHSMRGLLMYDNDLFAQSYQGLYKLNLQENSIQTIEVPGNKLGNAIISSGSNILFGSYQKPLVFWNSLTSQYKILHSEEKLEFQCFELINDKKIWTGTQKGIFEVDLENLNIQPGPITSGLILDIYENQDFIYLASSEGLLKLNKEDYSKKESSFENDRISHIYEDENGILWISTRGSGLIKWNPLTKDSKFFNTKTGFSNNFIHCAYPDSLGNLWLTSNFGLIRFNKESESVQTFFKKDGLSDDEFNILSHYQGSDGTLFFGGLNGITWFHPNDFEKEAEKPTPLKIISSKIFSLNNGIYEWKASDFPLKIKSTDAYAEIGVSPLIFEEDPYYLFSWRIKELQNNWVVQNSSIIRLNNLPHGNYTLLIKYSKSGNSASSDELEIPLEISQPLLLRWPFIVLYILSVFGLGILIARTRNQALIRSNKRLEKEVEKRTLLLEKRTKQAEFDRETIHLQSEELKNIDELKTNFFANITHELRTPLTLILGPLERLINAKKDPDGSLAVVHRNGLRLMNLVEELLDLTKIEAKKIDLNEKPLGLYVFFKSCISNFETFAEQKGIQIQFEFGLEEEIHFLLDEKKLEKIITNLLSNAIKHTPPKGSIFIQVKKEGPRLKIIVKDNGKGIIASDLPFVFERYFQSKENEKLQGGTGIGLALSREYVKAMGGDIAVESEMGKGATFTVTLFPKALDSNLPLRKKKQSPIRHTILIVDDQVDIQWHIKNLLEKEYQILSSNNGKEALAVLQNEKVDLAIVDIMMPVMDGYELLKIIRSQNFDFPIIFLTALSDLSKQTSALRMGVDDYLTKPFQELELKSRIRNLITRYETRKVLKMNPDFSLDISINPGESVVSFDQKWMAKLEKTILENLKHSDFTIQMLAEQLNISKRNLYYKIEAYTGMTPNQFLTEIRLLEARKLLEKRVYETVAEVCFAVGFSTTRYFSKLFNERFGKFPSDYKNSPL